MDPDRRGSLIHGVIQPVVEKALISDRPKCEGQGRSEFGIQIRPIGQDQFKCVGWHGGTDC